MATIVATPSTGTSDIIWIPTSIVTGHNIYINYLFLSFQQFPAWSIINTAS